MSYSLPPLSSHRRPQWIDGTDFEKDLDEQTAIQEEVTPHQQAIETEELTIGQTRIPTASGGATAASSKEEEGELSTGGGGGG